MNTKAKKNQVTTPDLLHTDNGAVRVLSMNPESVVTIQGRDIKVGQIPLSIYTLECSHMGKGLAVAKGDLLFCDNCSGTSRVVKSES